MDRSTKKDPHSGSVDKGDVLPTYVESVSGSSVEADSSSGQHLARSQAEPNPFADQPATSDKDTEADEEDIYDKDEEDLDKQYFSTLTKVKPNTQYQSYYPSSESDNTSERSSVCDGQRVSWDILRRPLFPSQQMKSASHVHRSSTPRTTLDTKTDKPMDLNQLPSQLAAQNQSPPQALLRRMPGVRKQRPKKPTSKSALSEQEIAHMANDATIVQHVILPRERGVPGGKIKQAWITANLHQCGSNVVDFAYREHEPKDCAWKRFKKWMSKLMGRKKP